MTELYPPIEPYATHMLPVSDIHTLYVEESGNPEGVPVLRIHGGPSDRSKAKYRQLFDPEVCRIICFDQRGCGKSFPYAEKGENTTQLVIQDIEIIRKHLGIKQWIVTGGSWGATLSLYYAQHHADSVFALVLNGFTACTNSKLARRNMYDGASKFFPDVWEIFIEKVPEKYHTNPMIRYVEQILDKDINDDDIIARFRYWNSAFYSVESVLKFNDIELTDILVQKIKLYLWYYKHHFFLQEDELFDSILLTNLKKMPVALIHGRYDMVCPLDEARRLHKLLPHSTLTILDKTGHRTGDGMMKQEIIKQVHYFVEQYKIGNHSSS